MSHDRSSSTFDQYARFDVILYELFADRENFQNSRPDSEPSDAVTLRVVHRRGVPPWFRLALLRPPWPCSPPPRDTGDHVTRIETANLRSGRSTSVARAPRDPLFLSTHLSPPADVRTVCVIGCVTLLTLSSCGDVGPGVEHRARKRVCHLLCLCTWKQGTSICHERREASNGTVVRSTINWKYE